MKARIVVLIASLVMVGCSGVPHSSTPQVIRSIDRAGASSAPSITPTVGSQPRTIVTDFLLAAVLADAGHSASRQFLTNDAARKWQDGTVVILDEHQVQVATITGDTASVQVTGRRVGQLDSRGVYSPMLKGDGEGDPETFTFGLKLTNNEWRIDELQPGVLINSTDFQTSYRPRPVYFFDAGESVLVPDLRYSAYDGGSLATWLLGQLVAGPRAELAQSVLNEIPDQVDPKRVTVTVGDRIQVEMPGSSQLDRAGRQRLAAQLAYTLGPIQFAASLALTDSGQPVTVVGSNTVFSAASFASVAPDAIDPSTQPLYVRNGGVVSGLTDKPVPGWLGETTRAISSAAVKSISNAQITAAAAVSAGRLTIGDATKQIEVALPRLVTSRPEYRPHADDVWVGVAGGQIYRVGPDGVGHPVSINPTPGGLPTGTVVALRFSSDGVRVAAVLDPADGSKTVWTGSLVRSGADVRIDSFQPVTPASLVVLDVGWLDANTIVLIGSRRAEEPSVWQMRSDGSVLLSRTNVGLPARLNALAVSAGQVVLVSASSTIWAYRNSQWVSYGNTGATGGDSPFYVP